MTSRRFARLSRKFRGAGIAIHLLGGAYCRALVADIVKGEGFLLARRAILVQVQNAEILGNGRMFC
jgi:hypothetical protein